MGGAVQGLEGSFVLLIASDNVTFFFNTTSYLSHPSLTQSLFIQCEQNLGTGKRQTYTHNLNTCGRGHAKYYILLQFSKCYCVIFLLPYIITPHCPLDSSSRFLERERGCVIISWFCFYTDDVSFVRRSWLSFRYSVLKLSHKSCC